MLESFSTGLSTFASLSSVVATAIGLYELMYSFGPSDIAHIHFDGAPKPYRATILKGLFRRRMNAQSIVMFAEGTGMYFPGGRRFHRKQIGFEVDVVFLDAQQVVVAISRAGEHAPVAPHEQHAASFLICNKGEASALSIGQKASLVREPKLKGPAQR